MTMKMTTRIGATEAIDDPIPDERSGAIVDTALATATARLSVDVSLVTILRACPRGYRKNWPVAERFLLDKPRNCVRCRTPAWRVCHDCLAASSALFSATEWSWSKRAAAFWLLTFLIDAPAEGVARLWRISR